MTRSITDDIPGYQGTGDFLGAHVHGLGISHVDALCHMFVKNQMYNGRPPSDVTSVGAKTNTVMTIADGIVGRGVLLDIAGLRGVPFLEPDDSVTLDDLAAAEAREGVTVGTGDILMIATGRESRDDAVGFAGARGRARRVPPVAPRAGDRRRSGATASPTRSPGSASRTGRSRST